MLGGFNYGGAPYTMIDAINEAGTKDIDMICVGTSYYNDKVTEPVGIAKLVLAGQLRSLIASHIGLNKRTQELYTNGELPIELIPMGTYVERIRAGGAGLGGFLSPVGIGTDYEKGKQIIEADGKRYILEPPLRADVAIVSAYKADRFGNLIYRGTSRNFNPTIAMAGDYVIAEVDEIVEIGELDPETIVTPGIFIDALVMKGANTYASRA